MWPSVKTSTPLAAEKTSKRVLWRPRVPFEQILAVGFRLRGGGIVLSRSCRMRGNFTVKREVEGRSLGRSQYPDRE